MDGSPDYKDPGAPLPIVPTPLVLSTITQSASATNPPTVGPFEGAYDNVSNSSAGVYGQSAPALQMPQQKSVFHQFCLIQSSKVILTQSMVRVVSFMSTRIPPRISILRPRREHCEQQVSAVWSHRLTQRIKRNFNNRWKL